MSTLAIGRALPASRGVRARQTLAGLLTAGGASGLTLFVAGHGLTKAVAVVIMVGGALWFASTRRTTLALAIVTLYLGLLDGYLKLSTGSNLITFVRDVLLYAIALGVLVRAAVQHRRLTAPPMTAWVVAFIALVLVQIANPSDGTLYHSLAGVRQHLEFVPLFFLAYAYVRTTKALRALLVLLAVIAAANGVVNYVQFHMTPAQLAAWGPGYSERVLGTGGYSFAGRTFDAAGGHQLTRPFGLMSDAGSGGQVCAIALGAILALASIPGRRRYLALAALTAVAAVVGILTSQERSAVVAGVVVVIAYALLTVTSRRALVTVLVVAAAGGVAYATVSIIKSAQNTVFRYQGVTTTQILTTTEQARGRSIARIPGDLVKYPLGDGLGVAGPATGTGGAPSQAGTIDAETEFSFATLEAGVPGMLTIVGFTLVLFFLGLRRVRRERDPEARVLLAAIVAPLAAMFAMYWVSAVTPTTPYGPYLWAAGGILSYWLITRPAELRRADDQRAAGA